MVECQGNKKVKTLPILLVAFLLVACASTPTASTQITISTAALAPAQLGVTYSLQLQAVGGIAPYHWNVVGGELPPGMALSGSGVLSGTPTARGQYSFTVQVVDSKQLTQTITFQWRG